MNQRDEKQRRLRETTTKGKGRTTEGEKQHSLSYHVNIISQHNTSSITGTENSFKQEKEEKNTKPNKQGE